MMNVYWFFLSQIFGDTFYVYYMEYGERWGFWSFLCLHPHYCLQSKCKGLIQ